MLFLQGSCQLQEVMCHPQITWFHFPNLFECHWWKLWIKGVLVCCPAGNPQLNFLLLIFSPPITTICCLLLWYDSNSLRNFPSIEIWFSVKKRGGGKNCQEIWITFIGFILLNFHKIVINLGKMYRGGTFLGLFTTLDF